MFLDIPGTKPVDTPGLDRAPAMTATPEKKLWKTQLDVIRWMDEILHHKRNPRMMIPL